MTFLALLASVFWATTKDLIIALFTGNLTDILIGVYYVGSLIIGLAFSVLGLILETLAPPPRDGL